MTRKKSFRSEEKHAGSAGTPTGGRRRKTRRVPILVYAPGEKDCMCGEIIDRLDKAGIVVDKSGVCLPCQLRKVKEFEPCAKHRSQCFEAKRRIGFH